jgi:hypothetical protein
MKTRNSGRKKAVPSAGPFNHPAPCGQEFLKPAFCLSAERPAVTGEVFRSAIPTENHVTENRIHARRETRLQALGGLCEAGPHPVDG